ncbi:hypothetical protein NEF87_004133 [Candidatus Lokiarchaeum ossiferum]|uniref:DUF47 family protein n=1 Tax=Candidatus Lokiarchaeum ossiferum TaxID=2951803 RepID=A0ABY6HWE0_9ARCH|nr:hypothetical protein NEF87_004133 [Candidatus Lokiarchaeum sp. B-35]
MDKIERTVFANLEAQSKLVSKTFKEMGICINAYLEGNEDVQNSSITKIRSYEKDASKIRRKNLEVVAQTVSIYRSDLLRLVMKMADVMANQAGASVRLGKVRYTPRSDDEMVLKFKTLIDVFIKMGEELRNLMSKLGEDMEKAHHACDRVDEVEEQVDEIYRDLHGHLYNREDIPLRIIMQLLSVAKHVEEACDHCASVADSVRIILVTH